VENDPMNLLTYGALWKIVGIGEGTFNTKLWMMKYEAMTARII